MAQAHPTTEPEQRATEQMAVFEAIPGQSNLSLIKQVEVPVYSAPDETGRKLSDVEQRRVAVYLAVTDDSTHSEIQDGCEKMDESMIGEEFMVLETICDVMEFTYFRPNLPDDIEFWNPNE
jgi:hypothetical protein